MRGNGNGIICDSLLLCTAAEPLLPPALQPPPAPATDAGGSSSNPSGNGSGEQEGGGAADEGALPPRPPGCAARCCGARKVQPLGDSAAEATAAKAAAAAAAAAQLYQEASLHMRAVVDGANARRRALTLARDRKDMCALRLARQPHALAAVPPALFCCLAGATLYYLLFLTRIQGEEVAAAYLQGWALFQAADIVLIGPGMVIIEALLTWVVVPSLCGRGRGSSSSSRAARLMPGTRTSSPPALRGWWGSCLPSLPLPAMAFPWQWALPPTRRGGRWLEQ